MPESAQGFLFDSQDVKYPRTARAVHIRRLHDILQLSIQAGNLSNAKKAFSILLRCKEIGWKEMWKIGLLLLDRDINESHIVNPNRIEFLRILMLQHPDEASSSILLQ